MKACKTYPNIDLQKHQEFVVDFLQNTQQKGLIVFHSVGSGKTILAITVARCLLDNLVDRAIIIAPKSVVPQWRSQFETLGIQDIAEHFQIESHEQWLNQFEDGKVDATDALLIVDEAHKFRTKITPKAGKTAQKLLDASFQAKKLLFLTATPIVNYPTDVNNMLLALRGAKTLPDGYISLNLMEFSKRVKCQFSYYYQNNTEHFPNAEIYVKQLFMDDDYYAKYMHIENEMIEELIAKGIKVNFKEGVSLSAFLNGIRRAVNNIEKSLLSPKVTWLLEQLSIQHKHGMKSLVYSAWKSHGVDLVKEELLKLKIPYAEITGATSMKDRKSIVAKYNSGGINILMITAAGSEGLDLKRTNNLYILEPHWNQTRMSQTIGRAVRYKSHVDLPPEERIVRVYYIVLSKPPQYMQAFTSADELLLKLSLKKQEGIDNEYVRDIIAHSIEQNASCK